MAGGSFQVRLCDDAPLAQQQQRYEAVGAALDQKLPVWRVVAPHPVHAGLKGRSLARSLVPFATLGTNAAAKSPASLKKGPLAQPLGRSGEENRVGSEAEQRARRGGKQSK